MQNYNLDPQGLIQIYKQAFAIEVTGLLGSRDDWARFQGDYLVKLP